LKISKKNNENFIFNELPKVLCCQKMLFGPLGVKVSYLVLCSTKFDEAWTISRLDKLYHFGKLFHLILRNIEIFVTFGYFVNKIIEVWKEVSCSWLI